MRTNIATFIKSHFAGIAIGVLTISLQHYAGRFFAIALMLAAFLYGLSKIVNASKSRPEEFYLKFTSFTIGVPIGLLTGFCLWRKAAFQQQHLIVMAGCALTLYLALFISNTMARKRL